MLGLPFAYATNGPEIIEFDYLLGCETVVTSYPSPDDLWARYRFSWGITDDKRAEQILSPINSVVKKGERYYAQIAINRAVEGIVQGVNRQLLTMAAVAFQICWKLWNARWNRTGEHRRPKILFLTQGGYTRDQ